MRSTTLDTSPYPPKVSGQDFGRPFLHPSVGPVVETGNFLHGDSPTTVDRDGTRMVEETLRESGRARGPLRSTLSP